MPLKSDKDGNWMADLGESKAALRQDLASGQYGWEELSAKYNVPLGVIARQRRLLTEAEAREGHGWPAQVRAAREKWDAELGVVLEIAKEAARGAIAAGNYTAVRDVVEQMNSLLAQYAEGYGLLGRGFEVRTKAQMQKRALRAAKEIEEIRAKLGMTGKDGKQVLNVVVFPKEPGVEDGVLDAVAVPQIEGVAEPKTRPANEPRNR